MDKIKAKKERLQAHFYNLHKQSNAEEQKEMYEKVKKGLVIVEEKSDTRELLTYTTYIFDDGSTNILVFPVGS